jgi:hypothetical protein
MAKGKQLFFEDIFVSFFGNNKQSSGKSTRLSGDGMSTAEWNTAKIIAACALVTLAWNIPFSQAFMWRYFSNSFASSGVIFASCVSMTGV